MDSNEPEFLDDFTTRKQRRLPPRERKRVSAPLAHSNATGHKTELGYSVVRIDADWISAGFQLGCGFLLASFVAGLIIGVAAFVFDISLPVMYLR